VSAAAALARAEAAGIRLRLRPDGGVRMEAAVQPPPDVLTDLRRWREDVAHLLAAREGRAGAPPPDPEAAAMQAFREAESAGAYLPLPEAEHRAATTGLMRAALMRPPAWGERPDCRPPPGAWCGCCGRNPPSYGGRWWQEANAPKGWRCATCYPPPSHLAGTVREVET
jgi:hypothetical protein